MAFKTAIAKIVLSVNPLERSDLPFRNTFERINKTNYHEENTICFDNPNDNGRPGTN